MPRKILHFTAGFLISFLIWAQPDSTNDIAEFLSKKAIKIDSMEVYDGINKFLNYQVTKGEVVWFNGSIITDKGVEYRDLNLNFNVVDNSLYLLHDKSTYRISNFAIQGFDIDQNGESMQFRKGYAVAFGAKIKAIFDGSVQGLWKYLSTYPDFNELKIKGISITENQETEFEIELKTGFRDQISGLKKFLDLNNKIESSESQFNVSEIGASRYLQVLYEHKKFIVLKYHFKRNATAESVSMVKHSASSFMFDDEDYFIADTNNLLIEFLFTKKSIQKVLTALDISYSNKMKHVGSEKGVVEWFNNNKFK